MLAEGSVEWDMSVKNIENLAKFVELVKCLNLKLNPFLTLIKICTRVELFCLFLVNL